MKSLLFIIIPVAILVTACILSGAGFWYYVLAIIAGNVIGLLGLFTWLLVLSTREPRKHDLKRTWGHD